MVPLPPILLRGVLTLAALLLAVPAPLSAQGSAPRKHLEITGRHRLRIVYVFTARWPYGCRGTALFYLPTPPSTGSQTIEHFTSSWHGNAQTQGNSPPHRILAGCLRHDRHDDRDLVWRVEIVGTFQMRQLVDGPPPPSAPPIAAPPAGDFLASTESIDWDTPRFHAWLQDAGLTRPPGEAAVDYGARLFAYLRENGRYRYPPETSWTASAGCRDLRTDCGGFSLIFVAACRANRIPARLLVGQWFKLQGSGADLEMTDRQSHVIAEFFDPQIGWIPEDISSSLMDVSGFADTNFFGRDPGYFFAWHTDTDFHFHVPGKADEHVQWIQNPAPWFDADSEDAADSSSHHWSFEPLSDSAP